MDHWDIPQEGNSAVLVHEQSSVLENVVSPSGGKVCSADCPVHRVIIVLKDLQRMHADKACSDWEGKVRST